MTRVLKYGLFTVAGLLSLLIAVVWFIAATETGTGLMWRQARGLLPDTLHVRTLEGRLTGPLTVQGVTFRNETTRVAVERVELDWAPGDLLQALLRIEHIDIDGLRVTQTGTQPAPQPGAPFQLPEQIEAPLAVRIERFRLRDFAFRSTAEAAPFVIDRAELAGGMTQERLGIDRLSVRAPLFDVDGSARVTAGGDYTVEGGLQWRLRPPGYAPAEAETTLDGNLRALVVSQRLEAPYNLELEASLNDLLDGLRLDLQLALDGTRLQAIDSGLPAVELNASASARGTPADLQMRAELKAREPQYGTVTARIRAGLADQVLSLDQVLVELVNRPSRLEVEGVVALAGAQPDMELDASWESLRWPLEGEALVASSRGQAAVSGTPRDLSFNVDSQATEPNVGAFDLSLDGRLAGQIVTLRRLGLSEREGPARLNAAGEVALDGAQPVLDISAEWQQLRWPFGDEPMVTSPSGGITLQGAPDDLTASLDAGIGTQGRITADASRSGQRIDLALDWERLTWPLDDPQVASPQGSARVAGSLDDYDLSVGARVETPGYPGGRVDLEGSGSLEAVDLRRIDIQALEGTLSGRIEAAWQPALDVVVDLEGEGLNPAPVLADWPGRLGLDIRARAKSMDGRLTAQLERINARGVLRGHAISLAANGAYDGRALELKQLDLTSGDSRIAVAGRVGESLDVEWRINSDDLSQLLPAAAGRVNGQGSARGPLRMPQVQAELTGRGLEYQDYALEGLDLDASLDLSGEDESRLSLTARNGRAGDITIDRVRLDGRGNAPDHGLELSVQTSTGTAELAVDGVLTDPWQAGAAWTGELTRAELAYPELAPWQLREAATLQIDAGQVSVSRHCWRSGDSLLCLEGERGAQGLNGRFTLEALDFGYFAAMLPDNLLLEGAFSGSGEIRQAGDRALTADVTLRTTAGRIGTREAESSDDDAGKMLSAVSFRESDIRIQAGQAGLTASAELRLQQPGGLQLEARIPGGESAFMERPLDGRVTADMPDLSFIAELIPAMERMEGRLAGDISLGGTIRAPVVQGEMALLDAGAVLAGPGLELTDVNVTLRGKGVSGFRLEASAVSGDGTLTLEGDADFAGAAPSVDMSIQGDTFQVFNTSEARVFASPDLNVNVHDERVDITGTVEIPRADITPHKTPASAVTVSSDQVIVQPDTESEVQQAERATGHSIHTEVRIVLGDEVRIEGFGLKARFSGDLLVIGEPGEPTKGSGEIRIVEGRYEAYGQDLTIEDGRLVFPGGPISKPGLNVRAVRRPDEDVLVGVTVRGSLRQPDFTLFSEPSMSQQEQLSYLVLGRSLQESSGSESAAVSRAALALGLKSGHSLAKRIGDRIGVDEVQVGSSETTTGTEQAALVLGKYLSPDLYISYGIGLLEPVSTVRLQYAISSKWKLVSESSGDRSSGDIIYTIERGE